jgi:UDP-N-acetyl-D-mannosaminuronate dehydrogenase
MQSQWHFGIIGLGRIGMRHAQEIQAHPNAQWVSAYDIDSQKIPAAFKKHPNLKDFFEERPMKMSVQDNESSENQSDQALSVEIQKLSLEDGD